MCLPSEATKAFNTVIAGYAGFLITPHIGRRIAAEMMERIDVRAVLVRSMDAGIVVADVFPHHAQGYRLTLGVADMLLTVGALS